MINIAKNLGCGQYYLRKGSLIGDFTVTSFKNIEKIMVPFLDKYSLIGSKSQDYADFRLIVMLIKNKEHLTEKGLEEIRLISSRINKSRIHLPNNSQATQLSEVNQATSRWDASPPLKPRTLRSLAALNLESKKYYSTVNNTFSLVRGNASKADIGIGETVSFKE
jgi:hypothetical protein